MIKRKRDPRYRKHITRRLVLFLVVFMALFTIVNGIGLLVTVIAVGNAHVESYFAMPYYVRSEYPVEVLDESIAKGRLTDQVTESNERITNMLEKWYSGRLSGFFVFYTDDGENFYYAAGVGDFTRELGEQIDFGENATETQMEALKSLHEAENVENMKDFGIESSDPLSEANLSEDKKNHYYDDCGIITITDPNGLDHAIYFTVGKGAHTYYYCADFGSEVAGGLLTELADSILTLVSFYATAIIVFYVAGFVLMYLLVKRGVVNHIKKLDLAAKSFAKQTKEENDPNNWEYVRPKIKTKDELQSLADTVYELSESMKESTIKLMEESATKERLSAELSLANSIQKDALISNFPAFPDRDDFDIYASMTPAKEVGGDFYDFFLLDDDHIGFLIADVSSKGVPAALFMMRAKTLIRSSMDFSSSIDRVFYNANNRLCEGNEEDMFVTCWMAVVELSTGRMTYVNAGHDPAFLIRGKEAKEIPTDTNASLAFFEDVDYSSDTMKLEPGDKIFLYTDGLNEAQNAAEEFFGMDRLVASMTAHSGESPQEMGTAVVKDMEDFIAGAPRFDDVTVVVFEYK